METINNYIIAAQHTIQDDTHLLSVLITAVDTGSYLYYIYIYI